MRNRLRLLLAAAVIAAAATTAAASAQAGAVIVADPVCPASTNWDNILHRCK